MAEDGPLGYKDDGVFAGSRVTGLGDDVWSHALTESWRHSRIFLMNTFSGESNFFPDQVVLLSRVLGIVWAWKDLLRWNGGAAMEQCARAQASCRGSLAIML